jgi:hypothetical protein
MATDLTHERLFWKRRLSISPVRLRRHENEVISIFSIFGCVKNEPKLSNERRQAIFKKIQD